MRTMDEKMGGEVQRFVCIIERTLEAKFYDKFMSRHRFTQPGGDVE